jgi:hypothetical protein
MSEYDQRQYRLMLDRLEFFDDGDSFHPSVLPDLDVLVRVLEAPDPSWTSAFHDGLERLEIDTSIAFFRWEAAGEPASEDFFYTEEAIERMRETVVEMKRLVLQKIEAPADDVESIE